MSICARIPRRITFRAVDAHRHTIPGEGRLVRLNGKPADMVREAAVEGCTMATAARLLGRMLGMGTDNA